MNTQKASILQFVLTSTEHPMAVMSRFFPKGTIVLNRTEWYSKEPRSCGITNVKSRPRNASSGNDVVFDIEITCRPRGYFTFSGNTKYDGWTAMLLDRRADGTLLDGHGNSLPEGQSPIYLPFEFHEDIDFNTMNFGQFIGEIELDGIPHISFESVMKQIEESIAISASIDSTFMAPRRYRPSTKIIISNSPSGIQTDGFGTRIVIINAFTPHINQVIFDELTEVINGFIEGRYSINNITNNEITFVDIDDCFVDCTPNQEGKESRFNCLSEFLSDKLIEDLAKKMIATYKIDVSIVDGPKFGFLLKPSRDTSR